MGAVLTAIVATLGVVSRRRTHLRKAPRSSVTEAEAEGEVGSALRPRARSNAAEPIHRHRKKPSSDGISAKPARPTLFRLVFEWLTMLAGHLSCPRLSYGGSI